MQEKQFKEMMKLAKDFFDRPFAKPFAKPTAEKNKICRICEFCGEQVNMRAKFCSFCGMRQK